MEHLLQKGTLRVQTTQVLLELRRLAFEVLQVDGWNEIYDDRKRHDFTILVDGVEDGGHEARHDGLCGEHAVGVVESV